MAMRVSARSRGEFPWHIRSGHRRLDNWPNRFACFSIKDEQKTLLGDLHQCLDRLTFHLNINQIWSSGQIVIPNIVVHSLEVPDSLAGLAVQRDDTVGKKIVTATPPTIVIIGWNSGR